VNDQQVGPIIIGSGRDLFSGWTGDMPDYSTARPGEIRVMMSRAGKIDPDSIQSFLVSGGYAGLKAALARTPMQIIEELEASNLQNHGGTRFPIGRK
jgi:NADH:ubiquinone oxidoreductase subunit F (NADH-binding)